MKFYLVTYIENGNEIQIGVIAGSLEHAVICACMDGAIGPVLHERNIVRIGEVMDEDGNPYPFSNRRQEVMYAYRN